MSATYCPIARCILAARHASAGPTAGWHLNSNGLSFRPDAETVIRSALTGPTSGANADYLAPGTLANLRDAGYRIVPR